MDLDRRKFLVLGGAGFVALGTDQVAMAELPALLRGESSSLAPAKMHFARAFNLWMDQAVSHEQEWSSESEDASLFVNQLRKGIRPTHGVGATTQLLKFMELDHSRAIAVAPAKAGMVGSVPAETVFARAFNLWKYATISYPHRWSHEADDVAIFRKQCALGIEPRYGLRAATNLLQFLEQAQLCD
jgi:hypothetical protein